MTLFLLKNQYNPFKNYNSNYYAVKIILIDFYKKIFIHNFIKGATFSLFLFY